MVFCLVALYVFTMCWILQLAFVTPFADDSVHGFRIESHLGGEVGVGLAVEVVWQGLKELQVDGLTLGYGGRLWGSCGVGQGVEDSCVVLDEDVGYGLGCVVVFIEAAKGVFEVAVFHDPER